MTKSFVRPLDRHFSFLFKNIFLFVFLRRLKVQLVRQRRDLDVTEKKSFFPPQSHVLGSRETSLFLAGAAFPGMVLVEERVSFSDVSGMMIFLSYVCVCVCVLTIYSMPLDNWKRDCPSRLEPKTQLGKSNT